VTDLTCEQFDELCPELALGVLGGRERADALAHVERCARCRQELTSMDALGEGLVQLTPAVEPPAGFESRVLGRLNRSRAAARRRSTVRLAVAAALAILIGIGGWMVGHDSSGHSTSGEVRTASFVSGDDHIGQVVAYEGSHPWVAVALTSHLGDQWVTCRLVERNGTTVEVGKYQLSNGSGYWDAPLTVSPSSVAKVQLVDASGTALATATFPPPGRQVS
jgi:anti-sigma factor RsiW